MTDDGSKYNARQLLDRTFSLEFQLPVLAVDEMQCTETGSNRPFIAMFAAFAIPLTVALAGFPMSVLVTIQFFKFGRRMVSVF